MRTSEISEKSEKSQPLIPGLPNEIAELCLLHLPFPNQTLASSVSVSWNRAISNLFLLSKKNLSVSLPFIFVFAFHKPTGKIQWQAFDPRSRRWFVLPPMPCAMPICPPGFACATIPHQGALFVLGGMRSDTEKPLHSLVSYRASTNSWSVGPPMRTPRSFFAAGSIGGRIFAVGGSGVSENLVSVERYDPEQGSWAPAANMRSGLGRYDAAVVGNKMYVTEGWAWPFTFLPRGAVYDADADTWNEMDAGLREGWTGVSVVLEGRLFVISEHGDWKLKVYVPEDDTWRYVIGKGVPRELRKPFTVSGVEGRIYVVARGLDVAIGRVVEINGGDWTVDWEVVAGPTAFEDFAPSNSQVLYA
ncbi:F-box protein AFR [Magnolia sinica]|uniref:F-box protein AFR n=1 Tax=Magnolia sinica TaxID=86752 RepID=UPI002658140A|nr:F-box protein AFR [Magnolia sinica]